MQGEMLLQGFVNQYTVDSVTVSNSRTIEKGSVKLCLRKIKVKIGKKKFCIN